MFQRNRAVSLGKIKTIPSRLRHYPGLLSQYSSLTVSLTPSVIKKTRFCRISSGRIATRNISCLVRLPPRSPNLNAFAERFVKTIKTECREQFVLFGENSLHHVIRKYLAHYHAERNKGSPISFRLPTFTCFSRTGRS